MGKDPERITLKKLWLELLEQLNLERGLGYTVKQFLLHPGQAVQQYLYKDRQVFTKPFSFLLLTTAVTTFLMLKFVIAGQNNFELAGSAEWDKIPDLLKPGVELVTIGIQKYFNLVYLISLPLVALSSYWVFRKKYDFNLAEYLVISTYIFSIQSILYLINIPFFALKSTSVLAVIPSLLLILYFVLAYKQIFELKFWWAVLYSLMIYTIVQGMNLVLFALVVLVGMLFA